eukprot:14338669-Ditylum_brightwellii.AAC.1
MELLKDPNVWVGDTGASCNSTGIYMGMTSRCIHVATYGVTMPNDDVKKTTMIADIRGMICDENGVQIK